MLNKWSLKMKRDKEMGHYALLIDPTGKIIRSEFTEPFDDDNLKEWIELSDLDANVIEDFVNGKKKKDITPLEALIKTKKLFPDHRIVYSTHSVHAHKGYCELKAVIHRQAEKVIELFFE